MSEVTVREARPDDAERCGQILFEAFKGIAEQGGFPLYFPSAEAATRMLSGRIDQSGIFGVVAEREGEIVGLNFLDERAPIRGIGPISIDPAAQGSGIGRRLMEAVLRRAEGAPGVRLTQDAHNIVSMSLYASLGFEVKDVMIELGGRPQDGPADDVEIRAMEERDLEDCAALHRRVHGFERKAELWDAIDLPYLKPVVALRDGGLTGYATCFRPWQAAHGVSETEADLRSLIAGAAQLTGDEPLEFLLPLSQAELFRWALDRGLRAIRPMTLMVIGQYEEPRGAWFPSALY